jgi:hypothetical protein
MIFSGELIFCQCNDVFLGFLGFDFGLPIHKDRKSCILVFLQLLTNEQALFVTVIRYDLGRSNNLVPQFLCFIAFGIKWCAGIIM